MLKRLSFIVTVLSVALTAVASAKLPAEQPVTSAPGVATRRAAASFIELAERESRTSAKVQPAGVVHPPMPAPHDLPVPEGARVPPATGFENSFLNGAAPAPSAVLSPPTAVNFQALGDNNTRIPPDVHGAVGGPHLMTTLNSEVRIQNRSGGIISTVSLQTFWSPVGPFGGPVGVFDPKVLYDPYNNRWMTTAVTDRDLATASLLIAVSQTSNPTGVWNFYRVDVDAGNAVWADYPSIGFNKGWICVQVNMYNNGGGYNRSHIYCFNKANLYAGGAGSFALISLAPFGTWGFTHTPAITYDNSIATLYVLQNWNGNSGGSGFLRLYTITGPVGAPVLTPVSFPSVPAPWDFCGAGCADFAPQAGSAALIANGDDRMLKVIYRNGTLWGAQTVFLPAGAPNRSSVQWWQLNVAGGVLQFGRVDDPVIPLTYYAYPSLAVNKNNDVLIGYSRFSSSQFASANYAYRASTDPPGTLQPDVVLKAGEATYNKTFGGPSNRWGDYSNTQVDPLDDKTLWTIQEYAASPANFWGTWWGRIGYVAGDINNDGIFTPADLSSEISCVFISATCTLPTTAYDMDCSGGLSPTDVVILISLVFLGTPPPC